MSKRGKHYRGHASRAVSRAVARCGGACAEGERAPRGDGLARVRDAARYVRKQVRHERAARAAAMSGGEIGAFYDMTAHEIIQPWEDVATIGECTLYLGDCLRVMPFLDGVDAVVTDPPYGIGEAAGKNKSRDKKFLGRDVARPRDYGDNSWDDAPATSARIAAMREVAPKQIIFGGNYYDLPPTPCWLVWDKRNGKSDFADCELAWTNLPQAVRRIEFMWNGMLRQNGEERGDHPTQKPVEVMRWCLSQVPDAKTILDPFMGSGTTGVACARDGLRFIGIEAHRPYWEAACRRIEEAYRQPDMLSAV